MTLHYFFKLSTLPIKEIFIKHKKGATYDSLSREYGYSIYYIRKYLKKYCDENNLDIYTLNQISPKNEIFIDRINGLDYDELTKKYNCEVSLLNDTIIDCCNREIILLNNILKKEYQIKLLLDLKAVLLNTINNANTITVGTTFSFKTDTIEKITLTLIMDNSNIDEGLVSIYSSLGSNVLNKKVGDKFSYYLPNGNIVNGEILEIHNLEKDTQKILAKKQ